MKPLRVLVFFLYVLVILTLFSILIPSSGIPLFPSVSIHFPKIYEVFSNSEKQYTNIEKIIDLSATMDDTLQKISFVSSENVQIVKQNSLKENRIHLIDSLYANCQQIEYPDGEIRVLYSFFSALSKVSMKKVRILHFGDSQVEGDHITASLRHRFQKQFGGFGPGLVPFALPHGSQSVLLESYGNWNHNLFLYAEDSTKDNYPFGLMGTVSMYKNYENQMNTLMMTESAWLKYSNTYISFPEVRVYDHLKLFYSQCQQPLPVVIQPLGQNPVFDTLKRTNLESILECTLTKSCKGLKISFFNRQSPLFYGISLESKKGIIMDNIPLRGSSGLEFTKYDTSVISFMLKQLAPSLIIFEFGVNVAPHIINDYSYYERNFYRQLKYLKEYLPNTSFLVVGISDMSRRMGSAYESYPNIELIRNAQKNAAFRAGCAFWDLYEAMGGKNSMPSWVMNHPPLAQKDFTHFNTAGANKVAQMIYNAIWLEYERYLLYPSENILP